mmetsp:Transcript_86130/g.186150  ORF Transcript_86130/g.186150 Transcript_86130/m.186150 type:complete len:152 (-) Transcript_86130:7-462(-)
MYDLRVIIGDTFEGATVEELIREADTSGDGFVSWEEFQDLMSHPKAMMYMSTIELDIHEAESLFHLLDDGDGKISFEEFMHGIVRLKGQARSLDVITILHNNTRMMSQLESFERKWTQWAIHNEATMNGEVTHPMSGTVSQPLGKSPDVTD